VAVAVAIGDVVEEVEQFVVGEATSMVAVDDTTKAVLSTRSAHGAAKAVLARNIERRAEKCMVGDVLMG
jgi:hypothetical protein